MSRAATPTDWSRIARLLLTSRLMDDIEERELVPQGLVTYQFSARGHELAQLLLGASLTHPRDGAAVYYRSRPFMLGAGLSAQEAFAAGMAKAGSPSEGRDVGVVFSMPSRGGPTILPASGNVGAQYTPAAGWAQAILYHQNVLKDPAWQGAVAAVLGGDGSVASNGFWSALTMATTLKLPLLFFIEDNQFAISVEGRLQTPGGNIALNLAAFRQLLILESDGTHPPEVAQKVNLAVSHVESGKGPCLLRVHVPRLQGHSFTDTQAYKSPEQRADENARDPLPRLRAFLPDLEWAALEKDVEREVRTALAAAQAQSEPDPTTATHHLFAPAVPAKSAPPDSHGPRLNMIDALRHTLEVELAANPRALLFGEDVGVKGGVHGATLDLQRKFGLERVFDTSLSEEGIIGRAVGMALAGLRPIPEIQFRKYADPATEQLNDCGTIRWRTAGKFSAPVVVRIPVGFGKKTGDPWHSVTGEAIFAHTPGWRIAFPSNAADAVGLLRSALRGADPTFFLEHRGLLDTAPARRPYPGDAYMLPLGQAAIAQAGSALTVVTWGAMVHQCVEASAAWPGQIEIIDLRTLSPWDVDTVLASIRKTAKCLVAHEDGITGGFGGEVVAVIAERAFQDLDAPPARLAVPDVPIPYNTGLMAAVVPSTKVIAARMADLLAF